jgi:hypothetical protein
MVPVAQRRSFHGLAFPAAVFSHEAKSLDECPMHPAHFAAAPRALLLHTIVISQFAWEAQ